MPSPAELALKLNRFVEAALANSLALDINTHVTTALAGRKKRVTWQAQQPMNYLAYDLATLDQYLYFLRDRHFSLVTNDGSILQLSFEIDRGELVAHRLNYVPCPVDFDPALLGLDSLDNVVESLFTTQPRLEVRLRAAIRFDFDPLAAGANHPASHCTINYDTVRVPVQRQFDASTFLKFVWDNFFVPRAAECPHNIAVSPDGCRDVFDPAYRLQPYVAWHRQ
jgi:hypothetical protein